ncbi:winged helix-turn-helix transcriptional regulator [Paucihalobacter sp.]|uniref:winged helix-turn-helix transcriptional regulator n=1 Tax=Paucihalobacter sp. TaxID=2850405 RepID=UPI003D162070
MENIFRSNCPLASMLDVIGDKWSLLIIRDMIGDHKKTFKEILASNEAIAPSVLSSKLKLLVSFNLIYKRKLLENRKENVYLLTEKGIALTPLIIEAILWSDMHIRTFQPKMDSISNKGFGIDKDILTKTLRKNYLTMVYEIIGSD